MKRSHVVLMTLLIAGGCDDDPAGPRVPDREEGPTSAATIVPVPTCTKTWASAIGGLWSDPSRWTPFGVPSITDHVCIDAPGTFDVFHSLPIMVQSLRIGGTGANVSFEFDPPFGVGIIADEGIWIETGSTLTVLSEGEAGLTAGAGPLIVNGELDIENSCACGGDVARLQFTSIDNRGRMELEAPMTIDVTVHPWENRTEGVVVTSGTGIINVINDRLLLTCGTIVGSTQIHVTNLYWCHGTIGSISTAHSVVQVNGGVLSLPGFAPQGMVTANAQGGDLTISVGTIIGPDVEIAITTEQDDEIRIVSMSGSPAPPINDGYIRILPAGNTAVEFSAFTNRGRFEVIGAGEVDLTGDEFINEGTFTISSLTPGVSFSTSGGVLRNHGEIVAGNPSELYMAPGTEFVAEAGSHMWQTVEMMLDGATLRGDGRTGPVTSAGGSIQPGAPYGTLTVDALTLDAASEIVIDLAGTRPGSYSQLEVAYDIAYAGVFRLVPLSGPSGRCGEVFTPIKHGLNPATGKFGVYSGLSLPPKSYWRVQTMPDSIVLAGYDPLAQTIAVTKAASAVAEGGTSDQYRICLGPAAPTSNVIVVPTALASQLVNPAPILFNLATWKLPKTITLSALDDTIIEPTHKDTVQYLLRSSSPTYNGIATQRTPVTITDNDGDTNLQVIVQNAPASTTVGSVFEVVYRVTNLGPTLSTGATLTIDPQGASNVVFQQAFGATCSVDGAGVLTCSIAGQAAGAQVIVALVFQATGAGNVPFEATVVSHQPDADATNDQASATVAVN